MKPKPAKRPIARRMWANSEDLQRPEHFLNLHKSQDHSSDRMATCPVIVLRADDAALEEMVDIGAKAIICSDCAPFEYGHDQRESATIAARAVLTALGLKQRKARK